MKGYAYHREARAEYHAEIEYYRGISRKLGQAFVKEVEAAIKRIRDFPEANSPIGGGLRRRQLHRFPHIIVYEIQEHTIFVWAVAHIRREPGYWKGRLAY